MNRKMCKRIKSRSGIDRLICKKEEFYYTNQRKREKSEEREIV